MKKSWLLLVFSLLLLGLVSAQGNKIEVTTLKDSYQPGDDITLKVSLLDVNNNPILANISLTFENADKTKRFDSSVPSNTIANVKLEDRVFAGYWYVTASYEGMESKELFIIDSKEQISFDIKGDVLTIKNTGNTPYNKDVQIRIGDTVGVKKTNLDVGEMVSYRLIAPDGTYSVEVVVDGKTIFSKFEVALTGNAIGILDENIGSSNTPITGARFSDNKNDSLINFGKNNIFAYVFVLVLVGAAVLLAVERTYNKMNRTPSS